MRSLPARSNNFALAEPRATVNFLIHDGKYPLCFRSAGILRRCLENAKKKPLRLRGSAGGTTSREPLVLSQKKDRRSRGEYTLCTTKSTRARRTRARRTRNGGGKKTIGKIRRNCAPVDTPAPGKLEIARIPMCKVAKARPYRTFRAASRRATVDAFGTRRVPGNTLPSTKRGIRPVCETAHANAASRSVPRTVTCGSLDAERCMQPLN